ncbi:Multidrug resistance-associated protein 4, partial [Temnothorax longispinosus]
HSDIDDSDYAENNPEEENVTCGRISGRVYKDYFHHGGNYFTLLMLLLLFVISQVATIGNDYWFSYFVNLEDVRRIENSSEAKQSANMYNNSFLGSIFTLNPDGLLSTMDAIYVYTFCFIVCVATTLFRNFLYMKICMNSSCNLHNTMLFNLLHARMSFFRTNPSGTILWQKIGILVLIGFGLLLIMTLVVQGTFSVLSRKIRVMIAPLTDRRVQLMSELVAGIQVVKMYTWEKPFSKIVSMTRRLEINKIKLSSYVRATYLAIIISNSRLVFYFTLMLFVLIRNDGTAN